MMYYSATVPADRSGYIPRSMVRTIYHPAAKKVGFDDYTIQANIQTNRTFNIILAERKYKPRNLYVDPLTLVATWDEPLAIAVIEDFEGATFPPQGQVNLPRTQMVGMQLPMAAVQDL
jgi:hypothetical protein